MIKSKMSYHLFKLPIDTFKVIVKLLYFKGMWFVYLNER